MILSGGQDGVVSIFDLTQLKVLEQLKTPFSKGQVMTLKLNKKSQILAAAYSDNLIAVWNLKNFQCLAQMKENHYAQNLFFSNNG